MRLSKLFFQSLRETPADAELKSHQFLVRGAYIKKEAAGIYSFLPMGLRVLQKVEAIVRREMNRSGAQEVLMPMVVPSDLWKESGRWNFYGPELLRFKDRKSTEFCLGPTHEEVITEIARSNIKSYKQLPVNLYQIQTKFRDEIRPRFGLMRGREFLMKDAYSFHVDQTSLDIEYQNMYDTYCRIFEACGLKYKVVQADSGNIGGNASQEFMVLADSGEDLLLSCQSCDYAANREAAVCSPVGSTLGLNLQVKPIAEASTPNQKTIEEVAEFLKVKPTQLLKSLIYVADGKPLMAVLRGDHELNEIKLKKVLNATELALADEATIEKVTNAPRGFAGPVGLKNIPVYVDHAVFEIESGVTGGNKQDVHLLNVSPARDLEHGKKVDIRFAVEGDTCPKCQKSKLNMIRGIEVGHIFKLGTKYSTAMKADFLNAQSKQEPMVMGCYGIGVSRVMQAAVEQNHDDFGPVWPKNLAPYQVAIIPANMSEALQKETGEKLYQFCLENNIDAIYDDRDERLGVKLKDIDLMGVPYKIILGKTLVEQKVEFKGRTQKDPEFISLDLIEKKLLELK